MDEEPLTVGRAADLVGVSVKTLHHWDTIGLVSPSGRSAAGYREYSGNDVARIHRVLVYRELGLPLAEIGQILDDTRTGARDHLQRQRAELLDRIARLEQMVGAVEQMIDATATGLRLTPTEQVAIFGADWDPATVEEAEQRWGDTGEWTQYAERAASMSADDWRDVSATTDRLNADLASASEAGTAPGSPEADALAERHRASIAQHFDCTHAMHVCLGRSYVDDERFTAYYDTLAPGLARWLRDVIFANARAHGVDPDTARWE